MATQGSTTTAVAAHLEANGWEVAFTCIPNRPHFGAVPIPLGPSGQNYPDVVAFKDGLTRLVEIEIALTPVVADKIAERFSKSLAALRAVATWNTWSRHVAETNGVAVPESFSPICDLVLCQPIRDSDVALVARLLDAGIQVAAASDFQSDLARR